MWTILEEIFFFAASAVVVGLLIGTLISTLRSNSRVRTKRRKEMLEALKDNSSTVKTLERLKTKSEDYSLRLSRIAAIHKDSDDVPGYCSVDDEEWPCKTAQLADLKKNAKLVD